ncbi:MAG TPA: hypothetical protein HA262_11470 [Methanosarcina sp.]|jgi:hypothetical protein|nr:hypothetical protein [Methanosarcina sp.]
MVFKVGLMDEEETVKFFEMINLRLKSEHVCQEEDLKEICQQVGDCWKLMDEVCRRIVKKVELDFRDLPAEK